MHTDSAKDLDRRLRIAAFAWLSEQVNIHKVPGKFRGHLT